MLGVTRLGLLEPLKLLIARLRLVCGLPLLVRHAVHFFARIVIRRGEAGSCCADMVPFGEAVATCTQERTSVKKRALFILLCKERRLLLTEAGQYHHFDILHIFPPLKVCNKLAKGVGFRGLLLQCCRRRHGLIF